MRVGSAAAWCRRILARPRARTHLVIWSPQRLDAILPVPLLAESLIDLIVQVAKPKLSQPRCKRQSRATRRFVFRPVSVLPILRTQVAARWHVLRGCRERCAARGAAHAVADSGYARVREAPPHCAKLTSRDGSTTTTLQPATATASPRCRWYASRNEVHFGPVPCGGVGDGIARGRTVLNLRHHLRHLPNNLRFEQRGTHNISSDRRTDRAHTLAIDDSRKHARARSRAAAGRRWRAW